MTRVYTKEKSFFILLKPKNDYSHEEPFFNSNFYCIFS